MKWSKRSHPPCQSDIGPEFGRSLGNQRAQNQGVNGASHPVYIKHLLLLLLFLGLSPCVLCFPVFLVPLSRKSFELNSCSCLSKPWLREANPNRQSFGGPCHHALSWDQIQGLDPRAFGFTSVDLIVVSPRDSESVPY